MYILMLRFVLSIHPDSLHNLAIVPQISQSAVVKGKEDFHDKLSKYCADTVLISVTSGGEREDDG